MNDTQHSDLASGAAGLPPDLLAALEREPADERAYLLETWTLADRYLATEPSDATFEQLGQNIWANLEAALAQEAPAQEEATVGETTPGHLRLVRSPRRLVNLRVLRYGALAACIALLIAVGLSLREETIHITAPLGQSMAHTLPDGSTVELNSGSTLTYTGDFGESIRGVDLHGEAFFNVTQSETPFTITSFNSTITVLGTAFDVRAWKHDVEPATVVAVASGTVRVEPRRAAEKAVILESGGAARIVDTREAPTLLSETAAQQLLTWREGDFKFPDAPLGTVVQEIERRFDIRINIAQKELLDDPVAILMENPLAAQEILADLCEYNGYQYRETPGGYEIFKPEAD